MEVEVENRSTEGKVAVNLLKFWRKIASLENMFGTIIKQIHPPAYLAKHGDPRVGMTYLEIKGRNYLTAKEKQR